MISHHRSFYFYLFLLVSLVAFGWVASGHSIGSTAKLFVNPSSLIDPSLQSPKNFTVTAQVANVSMLYGIEFKLDWNATVLNLTKASLSLPWKNPFIARNEVNGTLGSYWLSATATSPSAPFNGSTGIVSLTYVVKTRGNTPLHFEGVILGDQNGNTIGVQIADGFFSNGFHDVDIVNYEVWPTHVYQGDSVYINVTVKNVGTYNESFFVYVHADRNDNTVHLIIANQSTLLNVGESKSYQYTWNTNAVPYGSYWVTTEAVVPGDITPANNVAQAFVGGVCVRPHPVPYSVLALVTTVAFGLTPVLLFGAAMWGVFKLVTNVRIRVLESQTRRVCKRSQHRFGSEINNKHLIVC